MISKPRATIFILLAATAAALVGGMAALNAAQPKDPAPPAPTAPAAPAEKPAPRPERDPMTEPPMELDLAAAGKSTPVQLDVPFTLTIDGKPVEMKLTAKPHRTFRGGGVEFRYPRGYGFESETIDDEGAQWTFDGNNTVLIFSAVNEGSPEGVRDESARVASAQFGKANVKRSTQSIKLGDATVETVRLTVKTVGQTLRQDYGVLAVGKGFILFILQDMPTEDGETSAETKELVKMLGESFKVTAK